VDEALERDGRLTMLRSVSEVRTKVRPAKKPGPVAPRGNRELVSAIVDAILAAT
jgi:hypothetical protein